MAAEFKPDKHAEKLIGTRKVIFPLASNPNAREWSRLVVMDDGVPEPILHLLAKTLNPGWDPRKQIAYWKDANPTNDAITNVGFADIDLHRRKPKASRYGKAGTPEYYKAYREHNRERLNDYHRSHGARQRNFAKIFQESLEREPNKVLEVT